MKKIKIPGSIIIKDNDKNLISLKEIYEKITPTVLFEGNRVNSKITLSKNKKDFSFLEIFFQCNGIQSSIKIPAKDGKYSLLIEGEGGITTFMGIAAAIIVLSGNDITFFKSLFAGNYEGGSLNPGNQYPDGWYRIGINKILGWK